MRLFSTKSIKYNSAKPLLAQIPTLKNFNQPLLTYENPKENPETHKYDPKEYYALLKQFNGVRPNGINALSRMACADGLVTAVPYRSPENKSLKKLHEFIYGTPVVYADEPHDLMEHPYMIPGVMLHPGSPKSLFVWLGAINPHLGFQDIHAMNKWEEFQLVEKYAPGLMPKVSLLQSERFLFSKEMSSQKNKLKQAFLKNKISLNVVEELQSYIKKIIDALKIKYPEGLFIKHQVGCYTVDNGTRLSLHSIHADLLVSQLIKSLQQSTSGNEASQRKYLLNKDDNTALIAFEMLFKPENIILSHEIVLQKTAQGYPLEFRVDVIDFEPCAVWQRHPTTEYYPREAKLAADLIQSIRSDFPSKYRYFSFGADIGFDISGKPRLIEMNPGADSGFLSLAVQYNVYVSNLIKRPTPLIKILSEVSEQSNEVQREFLLGLGSTVLAHPQCDDVENIAIYLRDTHLSNWRKQKPGCDNAGDIMNRIRQIYSNELGEQGVRVEEIIQSTEEYFNRCGIETKMVLEQFRSP